MENERIGQSMKFKSEIRNKFVGSWGSWRKELGGMEKGAKW